MPNCKDCKLCRLNQLYILNHDSKKSIFNRYYKKTNTSSSNINNNETMPSSSPMSESDRTLRIVTLWLWIPSFALTLAYGITTQQIVLPLGNIPMTLSVLSTLCHLHAPSSKAAAARNFKPVRGGLSLFSDFILATFLMGLLIPSWILCAQSWHGGGSKMLGAYATVPMMVAFSIHAFFVLRHFATTYLFSITNKGICPHCNGDLNLKQQQRKQRAMSQNSSSGSSKESYHEVPEEDDDREANAGLLEREDYIAEPRGSTDDENERLIGPVASSS